MTALAIIAVRRARAMAFRKHFSKLSFWVLAWYSIAVSVLLVIVSYLHVFGSSIDNRSVKTLHLQPVSKSGRTLVSYIFADADPQYYHNLVYFVEKGVTKEPFVDYIIVIQQTQSLKGLQLPTLPYNARYIMHTNECYDWGTFGWLLFHSGEVDYNAYAYFIFVNSSVRGPFKPSYLPDSIHWTKAFTDRLTDDVKLVGPTISCVGVPFNANQSNEWRRVAHVQSYALATDMVGLRLLINDGNVSLTRHSANNFHEGVSSCSTMLMQVFKCHETRWDAVWYSELGSSMALQQAGFNIGSFLVRYQNIDFRDGRTWTCNDGMASAGNSSTVVWLCIVGGNGNIQS